MTEPDQRLSDQGLSGRGLSDRGLSDRSRWNAGRRVEVGQRVTVRRHLAPGESSHLYTDVIGHVVTLEPELVVRRESGEELRIPDTDIAVLKVLPVRPVRARDIREREYAGALAWPGTEFELVDGWFCRAGDDWSYRGDSAVPVLPWASCEDLDGVRDWYAARGLPLRLVAVDRLVRTDRMKLDGAPVDPARVSMDRELLLYTASCQELLDGVDAMTGGDSSVSDGEATGAGVGSAAGGSLGGSRHDVVLTDSPDDDWLALYHATADLDPGRVRPAMLATAGLVDGDPQARNTSTTVTTTPTTSTDASNSAGTAAGAVRGAVVFARYEDPTSGELAAIARGAVTTGPGGVPRVAVSCVETADGYRRRGLAEVVTGALVDWGMGFGAQECHLHVFADNTAGRGLWSKLGLMPHHSLRHLVV